MKWSQCILPWQTRVPRFGMYFQGWLSSCQPEPASCLICMGHSSPGTCAGHVGQACGPRRGPLTWGNRKPGLKQAIAKLLVILPPDGLAAGPLTLTLPWASAQGTLDGAFPSLAFSVSPKAKHMPFRTIPWLPPSLFQCYLSNTCQDGPGTCGQVPIPKEFWLWRKITFSRKK